MSIRTDYKNLLLKKDDISSELITDHGTGPSVQEQLTAMMAMLQKQAKDVNDIKEQNGELLTKVETVKNEQEKMKQKMEKDLSGFLEQLQKRNLKIKELEETLNKVLTENKELKKALDSMTKALNTKEKTVEWKWTLAAGVLAGALVGSTATATAMITLGPALVGLKDVINVMIGLSTISKDPTIIPRGIENFQFLYQMVRQKFLAN